MSAQDRVRWDEIYRKMKGKPFPPPDPLLLNYTPHVNDGETKRALDAAAGFGQNGLWLAEQGYIVDIMEISRVALNRTRVEVALRNLRNVNLLQVDFDDFELDEHVYDIVCVFRYLKWEMIHKLKSSIVPGGRIIYETFNIRYLNIVPEFNRNFLLDIGELKDSFQDWVILHYDEEDHITQLVAVNTPPQEEEEDSFDW
ncbi:MAG: hypothetical protein CUN56_00260 [Phototrophicales bacterium]|nr:MAG: hypothetical protein CUN56_00260 [Phototrophicales bacterium]RMG71115.1 MAG: class I SAM-dependent methyltransferase [Chloroflexota bacterium]